MTTVEILGSVVGVFRQCRVCGEWKPLEHFYIYRHGRADRQTGSVKVCAAGSVKVCAACRRRGRKPA